MLKVLVENVTARNGVKKHEKFDVFWGFFVFYQSNGSSYPTFSFISGSLIIFLLAYLCGFD